MMQGYAGPVQQGDMVIRANEVSPGITALLSKQNRKGAQGIYELPSSKPANPDYYNMALGNVQNDIRSAAQTANAMAPQGERLAFINSEEEGILRLLGGSGEPEPVTGIPSFARGRPGATGKFSSSKAGQTAAKVAASRSTPTTSTRPAGTTGAGSGYQAGQGGRGDDTSRAFVPSSPRGPNLATSPETGGRQTYYATDAASAEAVAKAREAAERQREASTYATMAGALGASAADPNLQTMSDLAMEGAEKEKGFFQKLFENSLLGKGLSFIMKPIEDYNFKWYMENINPDMGKKFAALSEQEQAKLKENKYLIPGYEDYWKQRREAMMADQMKRDRGDSRPTLIKEEEEVVDEGKTTEEEELPYFGYYRRFKQPMTYEDIIKRAYGGSTSPLLETIQEAIDREKA